MGGGEDQAQAIVRKGLLLDLGGGRRVLGELSDLGLLGGEALCPPQPVERLVARGRDQPSSRVARLARARPLLERCDEGLLQGLFREVEVAEETDQGSESAWALLAVDGLDNHHDSRQFSPTRGEARVTSLEDRRGT